MVGFEGGECLIVEKIKDSLSGICAYTMRVYSRSQRVLEAMRLLRIFRRLKTTWLGELLGIYRWKETWQAISIPFLLLVVPGFLLAILMIPQLQTVIVVFDVTVFGVTLPIEITWAALGFYTLIGGFSVGSAWGNPFGKR